MIAGSNPASYQTDSCMQKRFKRSVEAIVVNMMVRWPSLVKAPDCRSGDHRFKSDTDRACKFYWVASLKFTWREYDVIQKWLGAYWPCVIHWRVYERGRKWVVKGYPVSAICRIGVMVARNLLKVLVGVQFPYAVRSLKHASIAEGISTWLLTRGRRFDSYWGHVKSKSIWLCSSIG